MKEVTELYCHDCDGYFKVELDLALNGNHVVTCPKCQHEHCRVVKDGKVTGDRWAQRNGPSFAYQPNMTVYTTSATYDSSAASSVWLTDSWTNCTSTTTTYTTA